MGYQLRWQAMKAGHTVVMNYFTTENSCSNGDLRCCRMRKDPLDPIDNGTKVALAFRRIANPKVAEFLLVLEHFTMLLLRMRPSRVQWRCSSCKWRSGANARAACQSAVIGHSAPHSSRMNNAGREGGGGSQEEGGAGGGRCGQGGAQKGRRLGRPARVVNMTLTQQQRGAWAPARAVEVTLTGRKLGRRRLRRPDSAQESGAWGGLPGL